LEPLTIDARRLDHLRATDRGDGRAHDGVREFHVRSAQRRLVEQRAQEDDAHLRAIELEGEREHRAERHDRARYRPLHARLVEWAVSGTIVPFRSVLDTAHSMRASL